MITRSLFHLSSGASPTRRREATVLPSRVGKEARGLGERGGSVVGPMHKDAFPGCGRARRPDPSLATLAPGAARDERRARAQVEGAMQSSWYWSSTTNANNPNNAWNVNFNDGNTNWNNNKSNNNYVRAVRAGS